MLTRRALAGGTAASLLAAPVLARQEAVGEPVTYESGGTTIRAAVYRPAGAGRGAGIAFMHGSGGVGPAYLRLARQFAADGYVVIVPVYYDAAPDDGVRPESVMNAWRQAASDAVEWLIADGLPAERVGLMGYSLGSYVAVDSALGRSRAAAAIGVAGGWSVYVPRPPRPAHSGHDPSGGARRPYPVSRHPPLGRPSAQRRRPRASGSHSRRTPHHELRSVGRRVHAIIPIFRSKHRPPPRVGITQ